MMYDPPHPGEILREECIKADGLSIADVAKRLGVTEEDLATVLDGHNAVSADMAVRLEERMKWSTAEVWMGMQQAYDLWQARHHRAVS